MDLSQRIEVEQLRLQERSQIAHLQGQVDDLRHRLEQQAARAQLASEQARQVQDLFAQMEAKIEAQVNDTRLQEQNRLRAFQALQKEVAELRVRIEEPARQLLHVMAQIQDLQEGLRLLREGAAESQEGMKQLARRLEELRAQDLLREERLARLDTLLGQLSAGEEERQQATRQLRGEVEAEQQALRRQAADIDRLAADLHGEQQEFLSRLNRQAELLRKAEAAREALAERVEGLGGQFDRLAAEVQRVEREAVGRALEGQERLENLRQVIQREWEELRAAEERRGESQNTWLRRIEELYHGLDERLAQRDAEHGEALQRLEGRLLALEKGDEEVLRALLEVFQQRLQQGAEEHLQRAGPPADTAP